MTNISTRRLGYGLIVLLLSSSSVYSGPSKKDVVVGGSAFAAGYAAGVWGRSGEIADFNYQLARKDQRLGVVKQKKDELEAAVDRLASEFALVELDNMVESYVPALTQALSHGRHRSGLYAELQTALLKEGEKAEVVDLLARVKGLQHCFDSLEEIDGNLREAWGKTTTEIEGVKLHPLHMKYSTVDLVENLRNAHDAKVKQLVGLDSLLRTEEDGDKEINLAGRLEELQDILGVHESDGGKELGERLQESLAIVEEQTPLVEGYCAIEDMFRGQEESGNIDLIARLREFKNQVINLQGVVNEQAPLVEAYSAMDRLLRTEADGEEEINFAERLSVLQQLESAQGELIGRLQEEQGIVEKALRTEADGEEKIDIEDRLGWLKAEAGDLAAIQALLRSGEEDETEAADLVDQLKEKAEGLVKQARRYDEANGKLAEENEGLKRSLVKEKQSLEKEKGKYALLSLQYNALIAEREAYDGEEEEDEYVGESEPYSGDDEGSGSEG